jgi:PKD repeat protein
VDIGEAVDLIDTSTTNGGAIVAWGWDFGDGHTASGAAVSHAYDAPGSYDVTLTITDTCGYAESTTVFDAVTIAQYRVFLPTVIKH